MLFSLCLRAGVPKRGTGRVLYSSNVHVKRLIPLKTNISLTQMETKVENDGTRAVVTIPGFTLHDFDRTGSLNAASLLSLMKAQEEPLLSSEHFFDTQMNFIHEFKRPFIVTMSAKFFCHQLPDTSTVTQSDVVDLRCIHELTYVGNSSYNVKARVQLKDSCALLAEWEYLSTLVNLSTRRPEPLPKYMKQKAEKYLPVSHNRKATVKSEDFEPKTDTSPLLLVVREVKKSDIDINNHANYLFHVEVLNEVVLKYGEYQLKTSQIESKIANLVMWYRDECVLGDVIHAKLWKDHSTSDVFIHLVNSTRGNKVLNLCRVGFLSVPNPKL